MKILNGKYLYYKILHKIKIIGIVKKIFLNIIKPDSGGSKSYKGGGVTFLQGCGIFSPSV